MEENISPKYQMKLIESIESTLWETFTKSKYRNVRFYIEKWHTVESDWNNSWENFCIY